MAAVLTSPNN